MITKTLYRYEREPGCVTVSTEQPTNVEYTEIYRLIADEGKVLTKGNIVTNCVDTDNTTGWTEIDEIIENPDEEITGDEFLTMIEEVL